MKNILILTGLVFTLTSQSQENNNFNRNETVAGTRIMIAESLQESGGKKAITHSPVKKTLNFFIISKPKKIFDLATRYNIIRAKIKSARRSNKFVCIVAPNAATMASKVQYRLRKRNAQIGNIWFDSHGSYKKGYSFFTIGSDEFSYKNIRDTIHTKSFSKLALHCDSTTRIAIGSCYGGATYSRPGSETFKESKMNGDSLIIGMAQLFRSSTVYACESWVMTKPGLFKETFAMAGHPSLKRFKDNVFKPVWEHVGIWNSYTTSNRTIQQVNCIKLDKEGNIGTRFNHYQSQKKVKKQMARNISRLREGALKI